MTVSEARLFRTRGFGPNGPALRSAGKPAAAFPGRVATDLDMAIAVDRQQTRLALPMSASDTSITVLDPSLIAAYSLLSIDSEIVQATGPAVGNVIPVSRGFDGTTPAVHLASAVVSGFIDAYHHNRVVAEIEAIEAALGANLSKIPASQLVMSSNYDFTPQIPGGSLIAGANVINLAPVPLGINGSNTNHYVYISGGTGTPEVALITGGTAVSGASSGTLIIQCANTHSGAWTIRSATAGIQEAIATFSAAAGGTVVVPTGTWNVYAPVTVTGNYVNITGIGQSALVQANQSSGAVFSFNQIGNGAGGPNGFNNSLSSLRIRGPASPGTLTAVQIRGQLAMRITDNDIQSVYKGVVVNDTSGAVTSTLWIHRNLIAPTVANGMGIEIIGGADHFILNNILSSNGLSGTVGIALESTLGTMIIANDVYNFYNAILFVPGNGQYVATVQSSSNWYDSSKGDGFKIIPQGSGVVSEITSDGDRIAAGSANGISILGTASNIMSVIISNARVVSNQGAGIFYTGGFDVELNGCHVYTNSALSPGTYHGLALGAGASNLRVHGGTYAQSAPLPGNPPANTQGWGIFINGGASDNVLIEGAVLTPNVVGGLQTAGVTGTHNVFRDNPGYNPVGQFAITVGASPFTYTSGSSPETVYIRGGTVTDIKVGSTSVAVASPAQLALGPNQSITVTYSAAPTMVRDVR